MTVQEQWKQLRDSSTTATEAQLLEGFLPWAESFTSQEFDTENVFAVWRSLSAEIRKTTLTDVIGGTLAVGNNIPQLEVGLLFSLFQVLCRRHTFICTALSVDNDAITKIISLLKKVDDFRIELIGQAVGHPGRHLVDCRNYDFAIADYYELIPNLKKKPDLFKSQVQALFVLEADTCLYFNRIICFENGIQRATGFIYKSTGKPQTEWKSSSDYLDVFAELKANGIPVYGTISHADAFEAGQLNQFLGAPCIRKPIVPSKPFPFTAYAFKTSEERITALVNDIVKCPDNAIVFTLSVDLFTKVKDELRKTGTECEVTALAPDVITYFSQPQEAAAPKKRVLVFRGLPSPLYVPPAPLCKGTVFIAEHFLSQGMHDKILSFGQHIFEGCEQGRVYFSIEDVLFSMYENDANFMKFFKLIDFTEKYDPWKQIRRVLAKSMMKQLHKVRCAYLDEEKPVFSTMLTTLRLQKAPLRGVSGQKRVSAKMEDLCFCGSGKPFKECHGKRK